MNVMKSAGVGAAGGAVLGGMAVIPYLALVVIVDAFTKTLFKTLIGRADDPYIFDQNLVPQYLVLKSVFVGTVVGSLAGVAFAAATNCFFYAYNRAKTG